MNPAAELADRATSLVGAAPRELLTALRQAYSQGRNDEAQVIKNWLQSSIDHATADSIVTQTLKVVLSFVSDPAITPKFPKDKA